MHTLQGYGEEGGVLKLLIKLVNYQLKLYICKEKEKNMSEGNNIVLIVPEGNIESNARRL